MVHHFGTWFRMVERDVRQSERNPEVFVITKQMRN